MKKIFKELRLLMGVYKRYRVIVTNDIIEIKLTPNSNTENEINWVVKNDKQGKVEILYSLKNLPHER